jgi:xylan 1,4-beta-xylosidase
VDCRTIRGAHSKTFRNCVGAGRAHEALRADFQRQLKQTHDQCGFKYLRFHGLFHDEMGVYKEEPKGQAHYNWQYIDMLFDAMLEIGIRPFVELSFMPQDMASGDKTVFWWKANVTPATSWEKWGELVRRFTEHCTERYGADEVKTWYFEVWNEPNHPAFYTTKFADYEPMYTVAAKAVKSVNAAYRVGGPGTAGNGWVTELIEYCRKEKLPLDFLSTHTYSVDQGHFDESGTAKLALSPNIRLIASEVNRARKEMVAAGAADMELHYTEWSTSYTARDPVHDSYHSVSFILEQLKLTETVAQSMSYWVFNDIFEESGIPFTPFHGGFGLMNLQDIRKPAYFAFEFLNRLADRELFNADPASWACIDDRGGVQVLAWDLTHPTPNGRTINQVFFTQVQPAKDKAPLSLRVSGVAAGDYTLRIYRVGYKFNDAYTRYLEMGAPCQITRAQVSELKKLSTGEPELTQKIQIDGQGVLERQLPLRENDVYLVTLDRQ